MTKSDGIIVVSRHGDKFSGLHGINKEDGGIPVVNPGSIEDKAFIYITPESGEELGEQGREALGDQVFDNTVYMVSDFVRALQSAHYFTQHANLTNKPLVDSRTEIGFGLDRTDWNHEQIFPKYSTEQEKANAYIMGLNTKFFFEPKDDETLPWMGNIAYHFIKSIGDGLEKLLGTKGKEKSLLAHFTHTPCIDSLVLFSNGSIDISPAARTVKIDPDTYGGAVMMGEMFKGEIYGLATPNPNIEIKIKEKDFGYKLSDLRRIESDLEVLRF
ncbi:hypothetical protein HQ533_06525 [Candidatus Woesearchaeota archaeon]|nr:hypothetical protein [Candidatus Woesearchaeota archaeon]